MKNSHETQDDCFAFFSREELLEHQCLLLENELVVMGEELTASREKIASLVLCGRASRMSYGKRRWS